MKKHILLDEYKLSNERMYVLFVCLFVCVCVCVCVCECVSVCVCVCVCEFYTQLKWMTVCVLILAQYQKGASTL